MTKIEKAIAQEIEAASQLVAYEELKAAHVRVLRQLEKIRRSEDEYTEAVYRAARDAAASMTIKPVPAPKADKRKKGEEKAILLVADFQVGKVTPDYSTEIAASRVALLAKKVEQLVEIQRTDHPVREVNVFLLGDLVEGEDIYFCIKAKDAGFDTWVDHDLSKGIKHIGQYVYGWQNIELPKD